MPPTDALTPYRSGPSVLGVFSFRIPHQFKSMFSALLTDATACKTVGQLDSARKMSFIQGIYATVRELLRLAQLDPDLDEERLFMATLEVGLEHCLLGQNWNAAAVWVHNKLLSTSEQGLRVDTAQVVKELAGVTKFLGGPRNGGTGSLMGMASQQLQFPPTSQTGMYVPAQVWPTAPTQVAVNTPGSAYPSRGRGAGRGPTARKPAICNKCRLAGKTGPDIMHSYKVCPLVQCRKCQQFGHIQRNCPN